MHHTYPPNTYLNPTEFMTPLIFPLTSDGKQNRLNDLSAAYRGTSIEVAVSFTLVRPESESGDHGEFSSRRYKDIGRS